MPIANSGTYLATKGGVWEGGNGFDYANASYELIIVNFESTPQETQQGFTAMYDILKIVGESAKKRDLAENLLFWMSWAIVYPTNKAQSFSMSGNNENKFIELKSVHFCIH